MSNICNGQQLQQRAKSKIVSLTPLVRNNKMTQLVVSLLIAVVVIATLLESPAASSGLGDLSPARQTDQQIREASAARHQQVSKLHQHRRGVISSASDINTTATPKQPKMQQSNRKRSSQVSTASSGNHKAASKRFRGTREQETFISRESNEISSSTNSSSSSSTTTSNRHQPDVNNNNQIIAAIHDDNNNNNTVYSIDRTRQVNSLNGTIDLSRYDQDDVDRLYSDALLVYVKNFNETLPVRRETLSLGGNNTSRVPIYRSDTRIGSTNDWPRP